MNHHELTEKDAVRDHQPADFRKVRPLVPLPPGPGRSILLVANSAWNIWNFRRSLLEQLAAEGCTLLCAAPADGYESQLSALPGVRFIPLHRLSRKSLSLLDNWHTLLELRRLLRLERPDLVVLYTVKPNIFGSIAAWLTATPAIATVEGLGYTATAPALLRRLIFFLYQLAFRFVQKVVFLNHDDRAAFLYNKVVPPQTTLVIKGTGVDTAHFLPGLENGYAAPIFLFIGRLLSDKGIREFVRAAQLTKAVAPQARFQVLGKADAANPASIPHGELDAWIRSAAIEHLGYSDDVRPFIAEAHVVVLPSYREGMPRVLLEGMAMGKPIITTDSVGCRETVDEGRNGYIVPSEDAEALSAAMLRFMRLSTVEKMAMGRHSRQKALTEFSNDVVLPQYLQLLGETLQKPSTSR